MASEIAMKAAAEIMESLHPDHDPEELEAYADIIDAAVANERERCVNIAFREINNAGLNELAAITVLAIRDDEKNSG